MATIQTISKAQDHWDQATNQNFAALNKELEALPDGAVQYISNFAQLTNGAHCDGNGLYSVRLKNMTMHLFNIVGLNVPKESVNNGKTVIEFPDGTFGSRVRFNVDQGSNIDVRDNKGQIATTENFDNGLGGLNGEFVWFTDNQ